jgi:hypothetical protein
MPKFKLYSCKLRLEGSVLNEVPKDDVTVAEIMMFRALHGNDAIVNIVETGERTVADAAERQRVVAKFINPARDAPPRLKAKTEMFRNMFGHDTLPLPKALEAAEEAEDEIEEAVEAKPVARRTRVVKPETEAFAE